LRNSHWFRWPLVVAGFIALQPSLSLAQNRIGSAASITNQVEGLSHGTVQPLVAGSDIHANEVVRTADASVAQLVFLDNTNLSVGPKSSVTLDRFVYDPDRSAGKVVVRATRGVFRFVTGSQRPQNYTITTPIATIGVRGTVFDLLVEANRIVAVLVSGKIRVTTRAGRTVWLTEPGTAVTVFASGRVVGPVNWNGPITNTASNTPFPYFGGLTTAFLTPAPGATKFSSPGFMAGSWQPFLGLEGGIRESRTDFDVIPPFDVNATTGVIGVNGGLMFMPPGSNYFFGPRVGALFGFGSGSTSNPPASPAFTYKVEMPWTIYYEAVVGTDLRAFLSNGVRLHASLGGATVKTDVTGTTPGFSVSSSTTRTGLTASAGVDFAVTPALSIGAQFRYINVPTGTVDIPGAVPIASNVYIGTVGVTWYVSDVRLKRDIVPMGHLANGIRIYRYRYAWSDQVYVGAMAQEVRAIVPQAVMQGADGFLRVDYARLGMRLMTWDEWTQSAVRQSLIAN
jgi:hypothetical protein